MKDYDKIFLMKYILIGVMSICGFTGLHFLVYSLDRFDIEGSTTSVIRLWGFSVALIVGAIIAFFLARRIGMKEDKEREEKHKAYMIEKGWTKDFMDE